MNHRNHLLVSFRNAFLWIWMVIWRWWLGRIWKVWEGNSKRCEWGELEGGGGFEKEDLVDLGRGGGRGESEGVQLFVILIKFKSLSLTSLHFPPPPSYTSPSLPLPPPLFPMLREHKQNHNFFCKINLNIEFSLLFNIFLGEYIFWMHSVHQVKVTTIGNVMFKNIEKY